MIDKPTPPAKKSVLSPTVVYWYQIDEHPALGDSWFTLNGGGTFSGDKPLSIYDQDGFNSHGWSPTGIDRRGRTAQYYEDNPRYKQRILNSFSHLPFPHTKRPHLRTAQYSPTVTQWNTLNEDIPALTHWFILNGGTIGNDNDTHCSYDRDGFDIFGYDRQWFDRAGNGKGDYCQHTKAKMLAARNKWKDEPLPHTKHTPQTIITAVQSTPQHQDNSKQLTAPQSIFLANVTLFNTKEQ